MSNIGFVSKKKVAREIAKLYWSHEEATDSKERTLCNWAAQSTLNSLCNRLGIKPMHRNKLGGGTGEMIR